jgi:hypothetical protein
LAKEGIDRIDVLYDIEDAIRGRSPQERRAARQEYAVPLLNEMHAWMTESLSQIDAKSDLAEAFNYSINRWEQLCRYTQDGKLEAGHEIFGGPADAEGYLRAIFAWFLEKSRACMSLVMCHRNHRGGGRVVACPSLHSCFN